MAPPSSFSRRVLVVPLGFEYARLRDPVVSWRADKVVAIDHADGPGEIPYLREFLDELDRDQRIELERRSCDLFDLYDALGVIAKAIDDHPDDVVYVNLSAGSKITAIAGMIACMAAGAHPLYARPDYGPESSRIPTEPLHASVADVFELPAYPIERPSTLHVAYLEYIDERTAEPATGRYRGASKKELIAFGLERGFAYIADSAASSRHGHYRLLDRHVVEPLRERGYIELERIGRRSVVTLTPEGRNTLRAFQYLLERGRDRP